jgi:hypothetical protein
MAPALRFSEDVSTTGRRGVDGTSAVASELTYGLWLTRADFPKQKVLEVPNLMSMPKPNSFCDPVPSTDQVAMVR